MNTTIENTTAQPSAWMIVRQVLAEHSGEIGRLKAAIEAGARAALAAATAVSHG